jgi:hypothetical protein
VKPFHAQHNITSPHGNIEHVGFQMIIHHLEFDILIASTTLHCTPISDEDFKIRNREEKTMGLLSKFAVNKIMDATTINQHNNRLIFDVSLDLQFLWG